MLVARPYIIPTAHDPCNRVKESHGADAEDSRYARTLTTGQRPNRRTSLQSLPAHPRISICGPRSSALRTRPTCKQWPATLLFIVNKHGLPLRSRQSQRQHCGSAKAGKRAITQAGSSKGTMSSLALLVPSRYLSASTGRRAGKDSGTDEIYAAGNTRLVKPASG